MSAVIWGAMRCALLGNAGVSRTVCAPVSVGVMSFSREFAKAAKKEIAPKVEKIKRPKTPYIIFTMEARAKVISDKPTITFGEISSKSRNGPRDPCSCGVAWLPWRVI